MFSPILSVLLFANPVPQAADFETLQTQYDAAFLSWEADPKARKSKRPAKAFWPRFEALAEDGEARALGWMASHVRTGVVGQNRRREAVAAIYPALLPEHVDEPWIEGPLLSLADNLRYTEPEIVIAWLEPIVARGSESDRAVQAAALAALAEALDDRAAEDETGRAADLDRAGTLRARAIDEFGGTAGAALALDSGAAAVVAEYERARNEMFESGEYRPIEEKFRSRFVTLSDLGSAKALRWLIENSLSIPAITAAMQLVVEPDFSDEASDELMQLARRMVKGFPNEPWTLRTPNHLCDYFGISEHPGFDTWLDSWLAAQPDDDARAAVLFACGDALAGRDAEVRIQQGLALLRRAVATAPDGKLGKRAAERIAIVENIRVGKAAPDFETEDIDGVAFKLSDYRGKVVLLDFWGFW